MNNVQQRSVSDSASAAQHQTHNNHIHTLRPTASTATPPQSDRLTSISPSPITPDHSLLSSSRPKNTVNIRRPTSSSSPNRNNNSSKLAPVFSYLSSARPPPPQSSLQSAITINDPEMANAHGHHPLSPLPPSHSFSSVAAPPPPSQVPIPIPSAIPPIKPVDDSTPLPTLPIVVLCFAMISEFLSASVSGPFIFFMIEDFGVGGGSEAAVGFWAGIVSSVFFLSQFLTSLLWSNVSNKHGRRIVLFSSLLGNACTLLLFGSSTSLGMAICARLGQGVFAGAIGVARGAVRDLTDSTNEGRAIAWIGLCWGMGGIAGPIIGGLLEHPAENYPALFGRYEFLRNYPYILPCFVASCVTFTGAMLSLFLGWDGGYRTGKIELTDDSTTKIELPLNSAVGQSSSVGVDDEEELSVGNGPSLSFSRTSTRNQDLFGSLSSNPHSPAAPHRSDFISRRPSGFTPGSAYGYSSSRRPTNWRAPGGPMGSIRSTSNTLNRRNSRALSLARSFGGETRYAPDYEGLDHPPSPTLNFAQRLLLANEDAVFGLHDVWLAAATTQDRDDEYSQMDADETGAWDGSVFEEDDSVSRLEVDGFGYDDGTSDIGSFDHRGRALIQQHQNSQASKARLQSQSSARPSDFGGGRPRLNPRLTSPGPSTCNPAGGAGFQSSSYSANRFQNTIRSASVVSARPAIFENTGLATPPSMVGGTPFPRYDSLPQSYHHSIRDRLTTEGDEDASESTVSNNNLSIIPENHRSDLPSNLTAQQGVPKLEGSGGQTSVFNELPLAIICQYAIIALHGTTCDQVFMSFLVTPIKSGGLGLSAGHFAELIAAMCIAQIMFQFRFYPTVGPPRGPLSHLSMLRLGLSLYIPVYMLLPELRGLLRENQNGLVMIGMILLSSFRWLGNVCAYTSVMVMINAQTPPHLVPLANGLAQSAVSAARFVGPVFGGLVWSFSITPSVDARPYPFNNAFGFLVIALICFTGLLLSFRLK